MWWLIIIIISVVAFIILHRKYCSSSLSTNTKPTQSIKFQSQLKQEKEDEYSYYLDGDIVKEIKDNDELLRCKIYKQDIGLSDWLTLRILKVEKNSFDGISPFDKNTIKPKPKTIYYQDVSKWKVIKEEKADLETPSRVMGDCFTDKDAENAIKFKKTILMKYKSATGEVTEREVDIHKSENGVFRAWCHLRGKYKDFRIDRVIEWRML